MKAYLCYRVSGLLIALTIVCCNAQAQLLTGIGARYADSFTEWILYTDGSGPEGTFEIRWKIQTDWTVWEYRLGDLLGAIKTKFQDDPNLWELRGEGEIITIRNVYRGDLREWRISDGDITLKYQTRYGYTAEEWITESDSYGIFEMYTAYQGDPRDWVIVDETTSEISFPLKMAMVFATIFNSTPKQ